MANQPPKQDQALRVFVNQFHSACAGNLTVLGITSGQVTALNDAFLDFDTTLTEQYNKKVEAKGATAAKDTAKAVMLGELRELIRIIRTRDVPPILLEELGIGTIDPHHPVQPEQPGTLTVTPFANGTNWLRWQRGSNKPGTQYVVEVQNANTEGWAYVATTLKLNYRHLDQQPGFQQTYRVYALRNGNPGVPSFTASVYAPDQESGEALQLKAA